MKHPAWLSLLPAARQVPFATKLGLGISGIVLLVSMAMTATFYEMASRSLTSEAKKWGGVLCENLALRIRDPLLAQDLLRIKNHVDELKSAGNDVAYAFVMDEEDHVLAHTFQGGIPVDLPDANELDGKGDLSIRLIDTGAMLVYDFAAPVVVAGNRLGVVRVGLAKSGVEDVIRALIDPVVNVSFLTMILAVAVSTIYARRVTRRINLLREHAASVVARNIDPPDKTAQADPALKFSGDEIEQLSETFNFMTRSLRKHLDGLHAAEKELTRQKELMRTILDSTPDCVALQDRHQRYVAVNKAQAEDFGQPESAIVGRFDETLLPEAEAQRNREILDRILLSGQREEEEIQIRRDGSFHWLHVVRVPVKDERGKVVAVVRSARDVTQLKSYQDQLIQAQKIDSLGKLAGGVAHEINTPLGIILGYAQLLREDVEPGSSIHTDLGIIEKQTKVCRKIVADLLGFSRQAASAKMEMCFNNSILEAITLVRHTFELDHVQILTRLDEHHPIIYADPEKLKQVWINLLNNARDAMPGGGAIRVASRLERDRGMVSVTFTDTGEGIPQENLPRIFDPFFSTKGVGEGTGLGLSVSFGIIKDHGGSIFARSPAPEGAWQGEDRMEYAGPGSQFLIELPLDHSDKATGEPLNPA